MDREERPDVDRIYMTFVQATTGGGGWPMSVWLTPDLKPFFGGTYFPPDGSLWPARIPDRATDIAEAWPRTARESYSRAREVVEELRAEHGPAGRVAEAG